MVQYAANFFSLVLSYGSPDEYRPTRSWIPTAAEPSFGTMIERRKPWSDAEEKVAAGQSQLLGLSGRCSTALWILLRISSGAFAQLLLYIPSSAQSDSNERIPTCDQALNCWRTYGTRHTVGLHAGLQPMRNVVGSVRSTFGFSLGMQTCGFPERIWAWDNK